MQRKTDINNHTLFQAPYKALPWAIFALFVLCFVLYPRSAIYTHHLRDPDHYMRLNEVVTWLQGQSWYDLSVPRMSPGGNTVVHWSRLIDLPIAVLTLPLTHWLSLNDAALAASFIIPFLWFGILLRLLPAMAAPFIGKAQANLACLTLFFAPMLLLCYVPGNVDHHGVQVLIAGFALLSLTQILKNEKPSLFAILAAIAFSCGFWIGAEILPWAILFISILALAASLGDETRHRTAALFGFCLPLFTTALIPLALPASEFSSRALSWFSPAYTIFSALSGAILILGWPLSRLLPSKPARLGLLALLALTAAATFFALVPEAKEGIFADYDTFNATLALDSIGEAQPLINTLRINRFMPITFLPVVANFLHLLALPLASLGICAYALKTQKKTRPLWLAQTAFLAAAIALTLFWQLRVGKFMNLFTIIPLAFLLTLWGERLKTKPQDIAVVMAQVTALLLIGPLSNAIPLSIQGLALGREQATNAQPVKSCLLDPILPFLNDSETLGKTPQTIMNIGNTGPELLFRTNHNVVSGNFNVPGNNDSYVFFSSTNDDAPLESAKKWGAQLVLICKKAPKLYLGPDFSKKARLVKGDDGLLRFKSAGPHRPLIERLIEGNPPTWLTPVEIYGASDYLLYRIEYPKGSK